MSTTPPEALSCAAVRELDRRAIEDYGIPGQLLMENAGRATAAAVESLLKKRGLAGEVLVLCGPGNNGGDGFVIARTLANRGHGVRLAFVGPVSSIPELSADTQLHARLWRDLGRPIAEVATTDDLPSLATKLEGVAVVVDALFGTGLTRALRSPWLEVVRAVNGAGRAVVAVDVPSGLDGDTGEVHGAAVEADLTVTFVAPKTGFLVGEGPHHVGRVLVAEIGVPREYVQAALRAARDEEAGA